jgi:hypothetical protein
MSNTPIRILTHRTVNFCLLLHALFVTVALDTVAAQSPHFRDVTIDNSRPRRDVQGEIVDAHDGARGRELVCRR